MKIRLFKVFSFTAILIFAFNSFIQAQITSTTSSGRNDAKPEMAEQAEEKVRMLTNKVGASFKEGLLSLKEGRREVAREKFDKSVEEFLVSTL
ncbi:MAG TPA: hypothetical protein VK892_21405, partial [Pyrinomonadaceae bacterium]|nr:hypothetical protein [Pyrinomonadaceae bacterium]